MSFLSFSAKFIIFLAFDDLSCTLLKSKTKLQQILQNSQNCLIVWSSNIPEMINSIVEVLLRTSCSFYRPDIKWLFNSLTTIQLLALTWIFKGALDWGALMVPEQCFGTATIIVKILNLYIILLCTPHLCHFFPVSIHYLQWIVTLYVTEYLIGINTWGAKINVHWMFSIHLVCLLRVCKANRSI